MELDELKKELNQRLLHTPKERSGPDIAALIRKDTVSVVKQLERSLRLELAVSVVFASLCVCMLFINDAWLYDTLFTLLGSIALLFIGILYLLLRKATRLTGASPVKQNLQKLVNIMDEYIKRYLQLTLVLLPICFVFGVWLSYQDPEMVLRPVDEYLLLYLLAAMIVLGAGAYYFTRWYLDRLYGNYLRQLKALLEEFDEQ